jgi:hypothetical protein
VIATMTIILNPQQDLGGKMREEMLRSRAQNQKEAVVMGKPSTSRDHCIILADVSRPRKKVQKPDKGKDGGKDAKPDKPAKVNRYDYQGTS